MNDPEEETPACKPIRMHGLSYDHGRKRYKLKLTIDMVGSHIVGKRVSFWIPTGDTETAVRYRDAIMRAYEKLGLTVRTRSQKRRGPQHEDARLCLPAPVEEPEPPAPVVDEKDPRRWGAIRGRE